MFFRRTVSIAFHLKHDQYQRSSIPTNLPKAEIALLPPPPDLESLSFPKYAVRNAVKRILLNSSWRSAPITP